MTGAARGLGAALARAFDERGARLALLGLDEARLGTVAASMRAESACWRVDVTDDEAMAETARQVRSRFGPVSVVVANARVAQAGPFADTDPGVWRRVVEVNLIASAVTARCFLPDLLHTHGHYMQTASLAALSVRPQRQRTDCWCIPATGLGHSLPDAHSARRPSVRLGGRPCAGLG
ncbi:hypothetical protein GCM10010230_24270 [Streptomyces narbonensis]|nr:hypothetical protein GCM10010230_24270 [Streptomyces narbonensis]